MEASFAEAERRATGDSDDSEGAELCSAPPSPTPQQPQLLPFEKAAPGVAGDTNQAPPFSAPAPPPPTQPEPPAPPSTPRAEPPASEPRRLQKLPAAAVSLPLEAMQQPPTAVTAGSLPARPCLPSSARPPPGPGTPPSASHPPLEPPGAGLPASTPLSPAGRRRRHQASQARKKAKRATKAASGTSSLGYRAKASALPALEKLAAAAVRVDVAKAAVAAPGAYAGKRSCTPRQSGAPTLSHLLDLGFIYHPWNGR